LGPEVDPDWSRFAEMVKLAGAAIADVDPTLPRVLGGMSPIDPHFINRLAGYGALDAVDIVAVHGFPLDWNLWSIHDWPAKIAEIRAVTNKPVWVSEVASAPSARRRSRPGASSARPNF
jgi:beta-xylosidase